MTSFDLDKVSLKLASKNLVRSKLKPRCKIFSVLFQRKGFPYGLLEGENIRKARCSRVVLSKLLSARKANFLFLLVQKNRSARHARECSLGRPFVTPTVDRFFPFAFVFCCCNTLLHIQLADDCLDRYSQCGHSLFIFN